MLEERGEKRKVTVECAADLTVNANIPDRYVSSPEQRMDLYRRIAAIRTQEDASDLVDELMELIEKRGKPAVIEICDKEIECYIRELCKEIKIRVEYKPQLKQLSKARKEMINMYR